MESIPTNVYLDIYVTGQVHIRIHKICADIYIGVVKLITIQVLQTYLGRLIALQVLRS